MKFPEKLEELKISIKKIWSEWETPKFENLKNLKVIEINAYFYEQIKIPL